MRRYLQILGLQLRLSASSGIAYRSDFLIEGVMAIAWIALTLLPLGVLFNERSTVAGYTAPEALIVVGYFMGVRGVLEGVVSPSFVQLVEHIRSGAFDYVLLKPVDAQLMISASRFEPWKIFDVLGALAVVIYGLVKRGIVPTPGQIALGIVLFFAGVLAMYALWMVCAAASFWVVKLDNLVFLLGAIFDTARWPVQIFPSTWRFVFTFVLPLALMTTFPAMALMGRLDARAALAVVGGGLALLVIGRVVWRIAIRSYTSASS